MFNKTGRGRRAANIAIASLSAVSVSLASAAIPMAQEQDTAVETPASAVQVYSHPDSDKVTINGQTIDTETGEFEGEDAFDNAVTNDDELPQVSCTPPTRLL